MLFDLRLALRQLAKSPGFAAVALLTLALGIGANTAAFSVLNALLLHAAPYPASDALVRVYRTTPRGDSGAHSPANFLDLRAGNAAFTQTAAFQFTDFNLGAPGQPAGRIRGMRVTADFFPLLRTSPQLGRFFSAEEDQPGAPPVVVLSHAAWQQHFAGAPDVVGRTIRLDAESATIVGVMPPTFDDAHLWGRVDAWQPMALPPVGAADRENTYLRVVARLRDRLPLEQAQASVSLLAGQLALAHPAINTDTGVRLVPLVRSVQDPASRNIAWLVAGLAGFVLLIACANLANLQFVRNSARAREHAIRTALGASRAQLMRLVLLESLVLALLGGAAGLLLAFGCNRVVGRTFTFGEQAGLDIPLDARVLAFTFLAALLAGVGFGLLPAWLGSRADVGQALKSGGRGSTAGRSQRRLSHGLVVAQIAFALVLLAGAGYFVRGLQRVLQRDTGWQADGAITASLSLRGPKYASPAARGDFYRQLQERLAALPGAEHVAITTSAPTAGYDTSSGFVAESHPPPAPGRRPSADVAAVTPGYFASLGIRLVRGRDFTADDRAGNQAVVVVNESMARNFWPGEDPIGQRIGGSNPFMENPRVVIGVVSDVRAAATLDGAGRKFQYYRALYQWSFNYATIVLRSHQPPDAMARDLRRVLAELDSDQAIHRVATVREEIGSRLAPVDAAARMLVGFALLGVLLAALGIYGVFTHAVVLRTSEIGLRLALGASLRQVLTLILGGGLRLTLLGTALGLAGAWGLSRLRPSISPDFAGGSPWLTALIAAFLIAVALFACWLPARRATRVDPMTALRSD